jgi:hypothetical protein
MRKVFLYVLLSSSLALLPRAHAQNSLEYSGIGTQIGGVGRKVVPRMPTQPIAPGGSTTKSRGRHSGSKTIIVHSNDAGSQQPAARASKQPANQPGAGQDNTTGKPAASAVFILKSGEHIEAEKYLLTSREVQLTADRRQRTIPLSELNLEETQSTNRERGIELRVPASSGVVSLDF